MKDITKVLKWLDKHIEHLNCKATIYTNQLYLLSW